VLNLPRAPETVDAAGVFAAGYRCSSPTSRQAPVVANNGVTKGFAGSRRALTAARRVPRASDLHSICAEFKDSGSRHSREVSGDGEVEHLRIITVLCQGRAWKPESSQEPLFESRSLRHQIDADTSHRLGGNGARVAARRHGGCDERRVFLFTKRQFRNRARTPC
jgi:hypothetical protein